MITFEEVYASAEKAFKNNELYEFLVGINGYVLPILDASLGLLTDWTVIIPNGIFELYKNSEDKEKVKRDFFDAVRKMLDGSADEVLGVAYILFILLKYQSRCSSPFDIDDSLIKLFRNELLSGKVNRSEYDEVVRLNNILRNRYDIVLLESEA